MTLLKNEGGILPLREGDVRKVALMGPGLNKRYCLPLYGGSAGVWSPYEVTVRKGLEGENRERFDFVKSPGDADVVVFFAGLGHRPGQDSEVRDRASLALPGRQDEMIRAVARQNPNTVVVLHGGSPVSMPWLEEVRGVLLCWYPGMEGGTAVARTLFGDNNPSGKLPVTFPKSLQDCSAHASERTYPGDRRAVHYDEELFVGYRHFDKRDIEPLFPFGFGLSYTQFDYSDLTLKKHTLSAGDTLAVQLTLSNSGACTGAEVAQLYIADLDAPDDRPPQALKGFAKRELAAGESVTVRLEVPMRELQIYCPQSSRWMLRAGPYELRIGSSSRDVRLRAPFHINA
jgi:beta-glucosidase